jgi:putative peptide zinc metalloprotease protein
MVATSIWDTLRDAASQPDRRGLRLWEWLKEKVTLAQYRPEPAPGVIVSHLTGREGDYYILKNPQTKTYYRLSDRDYFLWQHMDGAKTVKDLVVAYFLEYGSFAFGRAATLVEGLKASLLLREQPVDVYRRVHSRLQRRRLSHRLSQVWRAFLQMQFAISGLDRLIQVVYRWGGRLVFTWPLQVLFLILSVVGLYFFIRLVRVSSYGLVTIGGSYRLGVIGLVAANLASFLIHEMSHALTVKHYGREVRRGGFMLYFGMPAFFVDTMDIWMEGKRARLAVTWAGPYSGLALGGLAGIVMTVWPAFGLNALLFQFAFLCYLTVFFNLNPLLELDGYFILMDWLEIPMLRQKSLAFVRRGLWEKLKDIQRSGGAVRETLASFSREERIFTVFGALSAVWTAYAIFAATRFWQHRLAGAVHDLWTGGASVGKIILALGIAVISLLFVVSIGMALLRMASKAVRWLARQGLFADTRNVAAILLVVMVALALGPGYLGHPLLLTLVGMLALIVAAVLAWRNARNYAGSRFAAAFWLLGLGALLLLPRLVLSAADGEVGPLVVGWRLMSPSLAGFLAASLGHLAHGSLFAASLVLFADTDLRELRAAAKALLLLGLLASYALVLFVAQGRPGVSLFGMEVLLDVISVLSPLMALTLVLPTLFSFWETSFGPAWATIGLALGAQGAWALLGWPPLLPYPLLAAGLFLHHLAYTRVAVATGQPEADLALSDRCRLERAFGWTAASVFGHSRQIAGERHARLLAEQFNSFALAAGWRISLVQGRVDDATPAARSLIDQGARYADALSLLLDLVAREVGEKLTVRALQRAYDGLPWEEREIGAQYLFRDVERAEALSQEFRTTRQDHRGLLRRNPVFATMDGTEIDLLVSRLRVERYAPGQVIIRQGDAGDRLYIIKWGHVEVTQREERGVSEVVNQLGRGDYFGELALLHDAPRNATCRATVPTEALCLSRPDFDILVRARFSLREKVDRSIARADLLRRMPLFAELDAHQIQLIAAQLREEVYDPGAVIIRQGEIGETFYVIESGRVRVSVQEDGEEPVVAERGRGEYAGEIALLLDVPRTATVTAITAACVLTLHKCDFDRLVTEHLYVSRGLERDISRRMIDLQRVALEA